MKVKTSELSGAALDWVVAKCEGWEAGKYMMSPELRKDVNGRIVGIRVPNNREYVWWKPSTDWAQGGPISEREKLCVGTRHTSDEIHWGDEVLCWARTTTGGYLKYGPTPLIAAMRCYVASKIGDEIEVPEELL